MQHLGGLLALIMAIQGTAAQAGPWLREEGSAFFSGSTTLGNDDPTLNLYAEYGWRAHTTLGLDLEAHPDGQTGNVNLFTVRPIGGTDGTWRASWNLGGGVDWSPEVIDPTITLGASIGRGIVFREKYGWFAVDGSVEYLTLQEEMTSKLDTTLGLGFTDQIRGMLQLFLTWEDDAFTAKLAPSLLYQPQKGGLTFQVGVEIPDTGASDTTLKLGIWAEF